MTDQLSALYSEFLEGGYDCVDRIVLNAYFRMGVTGEGFVRGGGNCTVPMTIWTTTI